ncbi:hypothetical protein D9M70_470660 [compost metagenome]
MRFDEVHGGQGHDVAAVRIEAGSGSDDLLHVLQIGVDLRLVGRLADHRGQPATVDDDRNGEAFDRVAVLDGGNRLAVDLVVGLFFLLLGLVARLRAGAAARGSLRNVLLDGRGIVRLLLAGLLLFLGHARGALNPRFRIEDRFLDLLRIGVQPRGDTRTEIVHSEEGRQRIVDLLLELGLHVLDDAERLVESAIGRVVTGGEQLSGRIKHGHVIDVEPRHGRGDQMADRGGGAAANGGAGADHDRGCGVLVGLAEAAALRHHDVDAGGGDARDLLDGAADFAF